MTIPIDRRAEALSTTGVEVSAVARTDAGHACGRCPGHSPNVIIDGSGHEVGVVVDFAQYVGLLGILATQVDRYVLPPYWRTAVEGCLVLGPVRQPGSGGEQG